MKKILLKFIIIIFVLVTLLIARVELININQKKQNFYKKLSKIYYYKTNNNGTLFLYNKVFPEFELNDLSGKPWSLENDQSFLKVLILFDINDCSSCLLEYTLWKKMHEKFSDKNVLVLGISHTKSIEDLLYFLEERDINFTILHDPEGIVRKNLGIKDSPLRILVNKDNEILDIKRSDPELNLQKEFLSKIQEYVKEGDIKN
jgi:peroxiredoxin